MNNSGNYLSIYALLTYVQCADVVVDAAEDDVTSYVNKLHVSSISHSVHNFKINHCNTRRKHNILQLTLNGTK